MDRVAITALGNSFLQDRRSNAKKSYYKNHGKVADHSDSPLLEQLTSPDNEFEDWGWSDSNRNSHMSKSNKHTALVEDDWNVEDWGNGSIPDSPGRGGSSKSKSLSAQEGTTKPKSSQSQQHGASFGSVSKSSSSSSSISTGSGSTKKKSKDSDLLIDFGSNDAAGAGDGNSDWDNDWNDDNWKSSGVSKRD